MSKFPQERHLIFSFTKKDFRVDTFRAGGPGGQNQNKRDTGVRITHIESGLSSESREHRTQPQNRKEAFHKLCQKLVDHYVHKPEKQRIASTKTIRTYHECDDRVVDHETGRRYSYRQTVGKGDISDIIDERIRDVLGGKNE
jgi:peptide chain release factor 1